MALQFSQQVRMGQQMSQQMKLAPRMIQSMEILQMPLTELEERVDQELEDNVVLVDAAQDGEAGEGESGEGESVEGASYALQAVLHRPSPCEWRVDRHNGGLF